MDGVCVFVVLCMQTINTLKYKFVLKRSAAATCWNKIHLNPIMIIRRNE